MFPILILDSAISVVIEKKQGSVEASLEDVC